MVMAIEKSPLVPVAEPGAISFPKVFSLFSLAGPGPFVLGCIGKIRRRLRKDVIPVLNVRQKIVVAVMDVFMIAEVFLAIYWAHQDPENFSPLFFKYFFAMLIPTLLLAWLVARKFRTPKPQEPS